MFAKFLLRIVVCGLGTAFVAGVVGTAGLASFRARYIPSYESNLREFGEVQIKEAAVLLEEREYEEQYAEYLELHEESDYAIEALREQWREIVDGLDIPDREEFVSRIGEKFEERAERRDPGHWAFRSLVRPSLPSVSDETWPKNGVDYFILSSLEEEGLEPAPQADAPTLLRRLSFDALGIPPTDFELKVSSGEFFDDSVYSELVDNVLEDLFFGEHWARYWLDTARYADSNGYEEDELREDAYPYRDFVIWAMNSDLPYDQFIRWQIAGDQIEPNHPLAVAATGFCTAGSYNTFMPQPIERMDELDDIVGTLFSATLGLSVRCARCHDHMYDPISANEYYQLVSIFKNTRREKAYLTTDRGAAFLEEYAPLQRLYDERKAIRYRGLKEERIAALEDFSEEERNVLREPLDESNAEQIRLLSVCGRCLLIEDYHLTDDIVPIPDDEERYAEIEDQIATLEAELPEHPPVGLVLAGGEAATTPFLNHGLLEHPGEPVGPGFLREINSNNIHWDEETWRLWQPENASLPRTALAYWLTDTKHGAGELLARVIVNRIWQWHFGRGIVKSSNDFGLMGDLPTHPELLDWLAIELIENNWSLKHIHRLVLRSATFQQSSFVDSATIGKDPQNKLVGRYPVRRLTAEMLRDAALIVCGEMNLFMYGPGVKLPVPEETVYTAEGASVHWPTDCEYTRPAVQCRTIYALHRRTSPNPFLHVFDAPDAGFSCDGRASSIVPTQALALMNAGEIKALSKLFAARIISDCEIESWELSDQETAINYAFMLAFGRPPNDLEFENAQRFLAVDTDSLVFESKVLTHHQIKHHLTKFCHVLFMTNEFLFYY